MEIGQYCMVWTADRMRDEVGFILGKRSTTHRGNPDEYLVAHRYDIEWRFHPKPVPEGVLTNVELCQVNECLVNWRDMPESYSKPRFSIWDRSAGWTYSGPIYGCNA